MSFDGLLLHGVVRELQAVLINARVHRITQPTANEVIFTLRQPGNNYYLAFSANPNGARLHLTAAEDKNPLTPFNFCMLLRKHLEPARLLRIEQPGWERVVTLTFEARDEEGRRVERQLILEIMGRHSNLLLVDPQERVILDGIRHVTAEQSRHREVLPGRPYIAPPAQEKEDPLELQEEAFKFNLRHVPAPAQVAKALFTRYEGLSPQAAREIVFRAGLPADAKRAAVQPEHFDSLWQSFTALCSAAAHGELEPWGAVDQHGTPKDFWVFPLTHLEQEGERFATANSLLDWYYTNRLANQAVEELRSQLQRAVKAALTKSERRLGFQVEALEQAARADEFRLKGELLLAQLHRVQTGSAEVTLDNYYEAGATISVGLDPSLSAEANAARYFKRYQKARKTQKEAQIQKDTVQEEIAYYEGLLDALILAGDLDDLEEIRDELITEGIVKNPQQKKKKAGAPRYLTITATDGTRILVGKNNRQNDAITMGEARLNDLWMHAQNIPGAHVVIRNAGSPVQPETLNLGLQLAAYYSRAKHSSQVPVDYCERRYVRKPKGAKPGFVLYDRYKTAFVTPDKAEIDKLQKSVK